MKFTSKWHTAYLSHSISYSPCTLERRIRPGLTGTVQHHRYNVGPNRVHIYGDQYHPNQDNPEEPGRREQCQCFTQGRGRNKIGILLNGVPLGEDRSRYMKLLK